MSSTNKTQNLHLNSWIGSDKPERIDFNYDNEIIDRTISQHSSDSVSHITGEERSKWNNFIYMGSYYGNGNTTRVINHNCPFDVSFGIVFAEARPVENNDYTNNKCKSYFAVFSSGASTLGVSINDNNVLTVKQSASAESGNNYAAFNENGMAYRFILFRDMSA